MPWLFDDQPPLYADYLSFPPRVTQSKGEVSDEMGDGDVHGAWCMSMFVSILWY